jgi:hypothetical protein
MYLTLYAALLSAYISVVFYLAKKAVGEDQAHAHESVVEGAQHA